MATNPDFKEDPKQNEQEKKQEPSAKKKLSDSIESLKSNEKFDDLYKYAKSNTADTIAYVALIVGILTLFFQPVYGGIIVGIVSGLYFGEEVVRLLRNIENFIEELGMVRSIVIGGLLFALFIMAFWIYIGGAIGVAVNFIASSGGKGGKSAGKE